VVHHGGGGTTAAALRAGVPQVVVPHIADQPYWGRRVQALGVGAAPIARQDLSVERLVTTIADASFPGVARAAALLGEKIRGENGVGVAAAVIADVLASHPLP
jgi:UDP:flavonoid glycosyltransferase YjiC (YdhE family)